MDIDQTRVDELSSSADRTNEVEHETLKSSSIAFTTDPAAIADATAHILTVPNPINGIQQPGLVPINSASRAVGAVLAAGVLVIYESTVYSGVTDDVCGRSLSEVSGHARD